MFEKILKYFNKDNKAMEKEEPSLKSLTDTFKNQDFQWVKGENMMDIENFQKVSQSGDDFFIEFKSGRRIKYSLLEEYLTWFPSVTVVTQAPPVESPTPVNVKQAEVTSIKYQEVSEKNGVPESPIYSLLARQKKKDVEIGINIKVPLPSKDLFNVLISSFDDAENEIIQFIIDSIDLEEIRSTLSRSIRENYYGNQQNPKKESTTSKEKIKEEK
jgi:hypothetical protein